MPIIVGHKGAAGYATENTLESFKLAIEIGCDRAEMDVRLTKDNEVVVFHDKEVSNLTDGVGLVSDMTIDQIQQLNYKDGGKIPTLQEVINVCKNKIDFQIELKGDGTPLPVNEIILRNNIEKTVFITSFKTHLLEEIKKINPKLKIGLLFWTDEVMINIWNLVDSVKLDFLAPFSEMITKDFVDKAHSSNKKVYAYGVNSKELYDSLVSMEVDEIGTDLPRLFI